MMIVYRNETVLEAARKRIAKVFDRFDRIFVSVSSGKDSTCLYHLVLEEAERRDMKVNVFFLDQEAEYEGTIDLMRVTMAHPRVIPWWYQVPIRMTNATSFASEFLHAWEPGAEWMREKEPNAITSIDGDYPARFYQFFDWFERQQTEPTAFFVGLRAHESMNRFRAVTKNPGLPGIPWSTKTKTPLVTRFYPIYDWTIGDVWKFIGEEGVPYNTVYDQMYGLKGKRINAIRVSNLIHEKSFACLTDLQEIEPDTHERLMRRIAGTHCAAIYARDSFVYAADRLPARFASWHEYRDYLLASTPLTRRDRFVARFASQPEDETIYQQQCRQILINDWENNIPVDTKKAERTRKTLEKWRAIL
jgi:predicted phosphoadenosine phosphosulfate sulfurtransferase